jgi:creatinine amidohydrolase
MKTLVAIMVGAALAVQAFAQQNSVWLEDMTAVELKAAIEGGKTTAIFYGAGIHENGPRVVLGKHLFFVRIFAERVARELGTAIVLPISPYAPAFAGGDPMKRRGTWSGTLTITDDTWAAHTRELITSAIFGSGFKYVAIIGDHGYPQDGTSTGGQFDGGRMKKVAEELDATWKPKGTHIFYVPLYLEYDEGFMRDILNKQNVPNNLQSAVDDASEGLYLEPSPGGWVRVDQFDATIAKNASRELGKKGVDFKISTAVRHIREETGGASR